MGKKILVVDDQPGIRMLLEEVFTSEGYTVSLASTGKEAIDMIRTTIYDLVILDYKLPVLNGNKVIQEMYSEDYETKIIVMSGMPDQVHEELVGYHVEKVIAKPFNLKKLCSDVEDIFAIEKRTE